MKTEDSKRILPLRDDFKQRLTEMKEQQLYNQQECSSSYNKEYLDYIFVDTIGNLIQPDYVTHKFGKLLKQNELRHIRFHDLRHSCASMLLHLGFSIKQIQVWLGHSSYKLTADTYSHIYDEDKVEMSKTMENTININCDPSEPNSPNNTGAESEDLTKSRTKVGQAQNNVINFQDLKKKKPMKSALSEGFNSF